MIKKITSPEDYFEKKPGEDYVFLHWDQLNDYFKLLSTQSDKLVYSELGKTVEGRPFPLLIISSSKNLEKLEEYRLKSLQTADPRGLTENERKKLLRDARCVCLQAMGLHADEFHGTQMSPLLVYELLTSQSPEVYEILKNVILLLFPCTNPDGQVLFAKWYEQTRGTRYEGTSPPKLMCPYAGHDANRDGVFENLVESTYINDVLFRKWMPQVFLDQHGQARFGPRMFLPPYSEPIRPYSHPLLIHELAWYGANISRDLEMAGFEGTTNRYVYSQASNTASSLYVSLDHNIVGILTETAVGNLASPMYIAPEAVLSSKVPTLEMPRPWLGGWWRSMDVVRRQMTAALSLLLAMSKNRERVLSGMMEKALGQTRRGMNDGGKYFIISAEQSDISAANHLCKILTNHCVEMYNADEAFYARGSLYPKGSCVIPLAQPKYALIKTLLSCNIKYPKNVNTYNWEMKQFRHVETTCQSIAEQMGVNVETSNCDIKTSLSKHVPFPERGSETYMPGTENGSFRKANLLLKKGKSIWRDAQGGFHTRSGNGMKPLRQARIGLFQRGYGAKYSFGRSDCGCEAEGWTRLLLERYGFSYTTVTPEGLRSGVLDDIDVFILPPDSETYYSGSYKPSPDLHPAFTSSPGEDGGTVIRAFVEDGGRLIALRSACDYVISLLNLSIVNSTSALAKEEYYVYGATLLASIVPDALTRGMCGDIAVPFMPGDNAYRINAPYHTEEYKTLLRFAEYDLVKSGLAIGAEEQLAGTPCIMQVRIKAGDAILYSFSPIHRMQTDGTYKLFFNALYV